MRSYGSPKSTQRSTKLDTLPADGIGAQLHPKQLNEQANGWKVTDYMVNALGSSFTDSYVRSLRERKDASEDIPTYIQLLRDSCTRGLTRLLSLAELD